MCVGCETQTDNPALQKLLVGSWQDEANSDITISFDNSGRMTLRVAPVPFIREGCTVIYTYRTVDFSSSGTYVIETPTHAIGNCGEQFAKANPGDFGKEKLDVTDTNHILLGSFSLVRF